MLASVGTPSPENRLINYSIFALLLIQFACAPETGLSPRIETARKEKDTYLTEVFREKGVKYPPNQVYFRAFKREGLLEIWSKNQSDIRFVLIKTYRVCKQSGRPGPKRMEGDLQVPEGFYHIDRFNDRSKFYLSLGLNYPNASDRILSDPDRPGSDIFIHGDCVSLGCLAMTDDSIKEIFWIAYQARKSGQESIPVHIFPYRFNKKRFQRPNYSTDLELFWKNLYEGYLFFEEHRFPPQFEVDESGKYRFRGVDSPQFPTRNSG